MRTQVWIWFRQSTPEPDRGDGAAADGGFVTHLIVHHVCAITVQYRVIQYQFIFQTRLVQQFVLKYLR